MNFRRHFNEKAIYRAVNTAILACICLFTPEALLGFGTVTIWNFLVLVLTIVLFSGVNFLKARGRILCLVTAFVGIGVSVAVIGTEISQEFFQAYLQWCSGNKIAQVEWLVGCQLMQTATLTAACYLVQVLTERFRLLRMGLACGCIIVLSVCLFARMELSHFIVAFLVLYAIVVYVEWLQEHWKKTRNGSLKDQIVWLSPFLAVYLLLLILMPAPENPYDWQWAKNIGYQIKESFLVVSQNLLRGGREDFGIALSGFSEDGDLGGGFEDDDHEVMQMYGQDSLVTNVYLIGKVYDAFDGKQWTQEYHDNDQERFMDTMETLYAVRRLDGRYVKDYLYKTDLRIRYEFFNTKYVFAPLKSEYIRGTRSDLGYTFEGGDMRLPKQRGYGTEYDVKYYQLNVGEELFEQLLEAKQEPDEQVWEYIARDFEEVLGQKVTVEMMQAHRERMYEHYLGHVELSQEVEQYLAEIFGDARTDIEKLQAIERELASFTYTSMPGKLPDSITDASKFLDYFLLESKTGYCAYFATAFVLLARAEGIPARYTQGFCVPVGDNGSATVLSNMAHSWPEVYMDGVGWIPFEPTPGYEGLRYTPWAVRNRNEVIYYEEEEELDEDEEEVVVKVETKQEDGLGGAGDETRRQLMRLLGIGIPALLAGYLLVLAFDYLLCSYRYQKMDQEEKFKVEVRRNVRVLAWLGLVRESRETLQELRLRSILMLGNIPLHFIEDYESVVYGGRQVGEEMIKEVKDEREQLLGLIRKEKRLAYIFCRMKLSLVR